MLGLYNRSVSSEHDGNDAGAAITAGLVGLGLGALVTAALMSPPSPREAFEQRLRASLAQRGIALAAAELGRGLTAPVWVLTLRLPAGLMNVQAPVAPPADPVAPALADEIAQRIAAYLQPYGLQVA